MVWCQRVNHSRISIDIEPYICAIRSENEEYSPVVFLTFLKLQQKQIDSGAAKVWQLHHDNALPQILQVFFLKVHYTYLSFPFPLDLVQFDF